MLRPTAVLGEMFVGDGRVKSKLDAGGSSGVGGGQFRGLPETLGRSGLVAWSCEPPDTLREALNFGEGSFPVICQHL